MENSLKLPTPDEVKDTLIDTFCIPICPGESGDYHCPDHDCPVWAALVAMENYRFNKGVKQCQLKTYLNQ